MAARSLVQDVVHTLVRRNPATGYMERTTYVGSLRNKPAGWRVDNTVAPTPAMARESGTA